MAQGRFRVYSSEVWSNATVLDGMTIETARVGSDLRLNAGVRLNLAAESCGEVHRDRDDSGAGCRRVGKHDQLFD